MNQPPWSDETLRDAFQTPAAPSSTQGKEPAAELLWDGVNGELSAAETARLVAETTLNSDRAEEWRLAKNLQAEVLKKPLAPIVPIRIGLLSPRVWASAAALFLIAAVGLWIMRIDQTPAPPTFRNGESGNPSIRSLLPSQSALSRTRPLLVWEPSAPEEFSVYQLNVRTEDLEILLREHSVTDCSFLIPAELVRELPEGAKILWQVSATAKDGNRCSSPTFITRLE